MLLLGDVVDMVEVTRLRGEVSELRSVKLELEKNPASLAEENKASADKFFWLLYENSGFVSESDSLSVAVKTLQGDLSKGAF